MQYTNFGNFIRNKRKKLGKALNAFAIECGVDKASISNFERGISSVYFDNFVKIAYGFGTTPSALLTEFEKEDYIVKSQ